MGGLWAKMHASLVFFHVNGTKVSYLIVETYFDIIFASFEPFINHFQWKMIFCALFGSRIGDLGAKTQTNLVFFFANGTKLSYVIVQLHLYRVFFTSFEAFICQFQYKMMFWAHFVSRNGGLRAKTHANLVFFHVNGTKVS